MRGDVGMAVFDESGRPSSKAVRPAVTAFRNALAMAAGSDAIAMAVFTRTASAPSSMAAAA